MIQLNFLQEKIMRKNNDYNIFKSQKNNPRILKVTQLIKKTLGEVFLNLDFTNSNGENIVLFVNGVTLSKDAKNATIYISSFLNKNEIDENQINSLIAENVGRIKKEFSSRIELRYTPKLKFKLDNLRDKTFDIDKALDSLNRPK